jgi:D-arabinose 1-dehydrogenase-like Zn-dependent alcohol dehydrogenase
VRVRVEACGICHTDAATVEGQFPGLTFPRVPGHEVVGRIDAIGDGVKTWRVGQRVGVGFLGGHCGVCARCRRGDFVNCTQQALSGVQNDGGYAEMTIAEASGLVAVPEDLDAAEAAPLLCAGVTMFNALTKLSARAGDLVAVQGIGGLGHLGVQFAKRMGFRVAAIARGREKLDVAAELGANHTIDASSEDVTAALQALGGARAIVATAANSKSMSTLIGGLAPRGQMVVVGIGGNEPILLDPLPMLFGERHVFGTMTGSPVDSEDTLAFSALHRIRSMIETVPLAKATEGYRRMLSNQARFRMVLTTG